MSRAHVGRGDEQTPIWTSRPLTYADIRHMELYLWRRGKHPMPKCPRRCGSIFEDHHCVMEPHRE